MVNKRKKPMLYILTFLLICTTFITMFGISASAAIDWSYSGNAGSGSGGGDKLEKSSYAIKSTGIDNIVGARYSFITSSGTKRGQTIDVFWSDSVYGKTAYNDYKMYRNQKNKIDCQELIDKSNFSPGGIKDSPNYTGSQYISASEAISNNRRFLDSNSIFDSTFSVPKNTSNLSANSQSWLESNNYANVSTLLERTGVDSDGEINSLNTSDSLIVEPLFLVKIEGSYVCATISELGIVSACMFTLDTIPTWQSNGGSRYTSITGYTNGYFPAWFYDSARSGLWSAGSNSTSRKSGRTMIDSGYGVNSLIASKFVENTDKGKVTITVKLDGEAWPSSGRGVQLYQKGEMVYKLTANSDGTYTKSGVAEGRYAVWSKGSADTGDERSPVLDSSGNPVVITVGDTHVKKDVNYYTLTLNEGLGINSTEITSTSTISDPNGKADGVFRKYEYVTYKATAKSGYTFSHWENDDTEAQTSDNPNKVKMNMARSYTAYTKSNKVTVTIKLDNEDWLNSERDVMLRNTGTSTRIELVASETDATYTKSGVPNGTYEIWSIDSDGFRTPMKNSLGDNVTITVNNNNQTKTINYYTLYLNKDIGINEVKQHSSIILDSNGNGIFRKYETATISATILTGYKFKCWENDNNSSEYYTSSATSIKMDASDSKSYTAYADENGNVVVTAMLNDKEWLNAANTLGSEIKISKDNGVNLYSLTNISGTGKYTTKEVLSQGTYYIWTKTAASNSLVKTNKFISISSANGNAEIDYYTLKLNKSDGITSVSTSITSKLSAIYNGENLPVYLSGEYATMSAIVASGYMWKHWRDDVGSSHLSTQNGATATMNTRREYTAIATVVPKVIVTVNKDNEEWDEYDKPIYLYSSKTSYIELTHTTNRGIYTNINNSSIRKYIEPGTYDIYTTNNNGSKIYANATIYVSETKDSSATVNFYTLTLVSGEGISTVSQTFDGSTITSPANSSIDETYLSGSKITINATPKSYYEFAQWIRNQGSYVASTTNKSTTVTINATTKHTATAESTRIKYTIEYHWRENGIDKGPVDTVGFIHSPSTYLEDLPSDTFPDLPQDDDRYKVTRPGTNKWYTSLTGTTTISSISAGTNKHITVYAERTPKTYDIIYKWVNEDGSITNIKDCPYTTNKPGPIEYTYGIGATLGKIPTCTGYDVPKAGLNSWLTNTSGTGIRTKVTTTETGTITVYAKRTVTNYTIKYKWRDGTTMNVGSSWPTTYTYFSNTITLPDLPPYTGYNVKNYGTNDWFTSTSGNDTEDEIEKNSMEHKVFYAEKTPITYYVHYIIDGIEDKTLTQTCNYDSDYNYKPLPTKSGYVMNGWYDNSNCEGTKYAPGESFDNGKNNGNLASTEGAHVYRYAESHDITKPFTITYYWTDDLVNPIATEQYYYNASNPYYLTTEVPALTGHNILPEANNTKWYTDPSTDSNTITYIEKGTCRNIDLYASKTKIPYTITFKWIDGGTDGLPEPETFYYSESEQTIKAEIPTSLTHYKITNAGKNLWYLDTNKTPSNGKIPANRAKDITVYAERTRYTYTVNYYFNGKLDSTQTVQSGIADTYKPLPTVAAGYEAYGWFANSTDKVGATTYAPGSKIIPDTVSSDGVVINRYAYSVFVGIPYNITYKWTDGTPIDPQSGWPTIHRTGTTTKLPSVPNPDSSKYEVSSTWFADQNASTAITEISGTANITKDITVWAQKFEKPDNSVVITLNLNNHFWTDSNVKVKIYKDNAVFADEEYELKHIVGSPFYVYDRFVVGSYDFEVHATNSKGQEIYTGKNVTLATGKSNSQTLDYYTLTLNDTTGIKTTINDATLSYPLKNYTRVYLKGETASINATPQHNYKWDKWTNNIGPAFANNKTQSQSFTMNEQREYTATATYSPQYNVIYHWYDTKKEITRKSFYADIGVNPLMAVPDDSMYTIEKTWYLEDGTTPVYNIPPNSATKDIHLYAKRERTSYKIYYRWMDTNEEIPGLTPDSYKLGEPTPLAVVPTCEGYEVQEAGYRNWYSEQNVTSQLINSVPNSYLQSGGDLTVWVPRKEIIDAKIIVEVKLDDNYWNDTDVEIVLKSNSILYKDIELTHEPGTCNYYNNKTLAKTYTYDILATNSKGELEDTGEDIEVKSFGTGGNATINYYSLQLKRDEGIESVSQSSTLTYNGKGIYYSGETATINSPKIKSGYNWNRWISDVGGTNTTSSSFTTTMDQRKVYTATSIKSTLNVNVKLDNKDWINPSIKIEARKDNKTYPLTHISGTSKYQLNDASNGTYTIYATDSSGSVTNTGITFTLNNNTINKEINYYTLKLNSGANISEVSMTISSGSTVKDKTISKVFRSGEKATINAHEFAKTYWSKWNTITGPTLSGGPQLTLTITEPREYTAIAVVYSITVNVKLDGANKLPDSKPTIEIWQNNSKVDILTNVSGTSQYKLTKALNGTYDIYSTDANGNITDTGVNITVNNNNPSATINYYTLKVNGDNGIGIEKVFITTSSGSIIENTNSITKIFRSGEPVKINATVKTGFNWVKWTKNTGPEISGGPEVGFTITETREYTATIEKITYVNYIINYWLMNPNNISNPIVLKDTETSDEPVEIGSVISVTPKHTDFYGYNALRTEYNDKSQNGVVAVIDFVVDEENATLNYYFEAETVRLTYWMNGGNYNGEYGYKTFEYGMFDTVTLITPNYPGYVFNGWHHLVAEKGHAGYVGPTSFIITKDTELQASWKTDEVLPDLDIVANPIYGDVVTGSQITVSATAINNTDEDITPSDPANVTLTIKNSSGNVIKNVEKTVIIPKNGKNLVYFNVDIPATLAANEEIDFIWDIVR